MPKPPVRKRATPTSCMLAAVPGRLKGDPLLRALTQHRLDANESQHTHFRAVGQAELLLLQLILEQWGKKNKHLSTASAGGKHCYCRRVKKKMHSIHQNIQMFLNRLYFLFVLLTKNCAVFIPCPWFFFFKFTQDIPESCTFHVCVPVH